MINNFKLGIISSLLLFSINHYEKTVFAFPKNDNLESVASHLIGQMETSAPAANSDKKVIVRMTTCKVNIEEQSKEFFLYQEQALIEKLDQPYRQRILQLIPHNDQQVESKSFKLLEQKTWVNLCDKSEPTIKMTDLGESICSVFLKPVDEGYIGKTPAEGCPTNYRGAVKITNTVILHNQGMDTYDRGFDVDGNLIWGAKDQGYQFRWIEN